ncbi:ABC-F family ATP-binding cassette domain-containing protein [Rufibacter hautae]|uniref:ABC-F family ATP-binding cassette domain-containing protein n=1 Tax=Rufibacter hautae TaxID=2595005 RepID=A0A5B6TBI6_9BACT|nr:ABC-F family ATP-binding cassette domain-containing protein [Rufibacter hautae]KAA3437496.1 ABC-F family ATP-binding cassette domain-containing protein [Rufibacter hautae]
MNYLSADSISKSYGDRWLFQNLIFGINRGQRIALIGANGAGKTTLLQILAGTVPPDNGSVSVRKGIRVGYLWQQPEFPAGATVQEAIFSGQTEVLDAIRDYEACLEDPNTSDKRMQQVMERMETLHAWEYEVRTKQILGKLGIQNLDVQVEHLSGGQKKRVAMARVLIEEPDLLILDEPTNHLDLETIEWFENLLTTEQTTLLMVTHDRYFLDQVANEIAELDRGQVYTYKGNYSYYVEKKAEQEEANAAEMGKAKQLLKKELEWMRKQPRARGTKSKSRVDAFYDLKDKTSQKDTRTSLELSVKSTRQGNQILEIDHLSKSFGEKVVLNDFSYIFRKKDRVGIVGPNGAGKTTFLNMLTGRLAPDSGEIIAGQTTVFGYYTQSELTFNENQRVIDVVKEVAEVVETGNGEVITASQFLQHFQFPPAQQYTFVSKLSGGEKRRLQLLRVLIKNPNFLILDEPTNDLDIQTLNILEDFLLNFGGSLLIVSHDRYFMDRLVEHLFVFEESGQLRDFPGNYTDYREWAKERENMKLDEVKPIVKEAPAAPAPTPVAAAPAADAAPKRKASFKEKQEYEQLEKEIENLEAEKDTLAEEMNSGAADHKRLAELAQRIKDINTAVETKTERWLELAEIV